MALARQKPRYGYRRLGALLKRRHWVVNHKRLERVYREEHLAVRRLKRKRLIRPAAPIAMLNRANQEWSMDFVMDSLSTGRGLRMFTMVDSHTRECLAIEVDSCFVEPPRDTCAGVGHRAARHPRGDTLRQWTGVHQSALSGLVRGPKDRADTHPARSTDAEWAGGEFQRPTPGRMLERELVFHLGRCAAEDRGVETGLQRAASAQFIGLSAATSVRGTATAE